MFRRRISKSILANYHQLKFGTCNFHANEMASTLAMIEWIGNSGVRRQMNWYELLCNAESCGDFGEVDDLYAEAIEKAQNQLGAYHPNVAKCFSSYGKYLEQSSRIMEARLNYKLAAAIYAIAGDMEKAVEASSSGARMDTLLGLPSKQPVSNQFRVSD